MRTGRFGQQATLPVVAGSPRDANPDSSHFAYCLDSRLLVMKGMIGEAPPMGSHYVTFDGSNVTRIKTIAKPEKHGGSPGAEPAEPRQ